MNPPRLLVAGATGTNGRELLRRLDDEGIRMRALVRDPDRAAPLAGERVELVRGDLGDRASLRAAFDGIEQAYIVTAVSRDTTTWFANFFDAARAAGVRHLVKLSGLGADPGSTSEIIRQHGEADEALAASGLTYTILRPNSFYQNILFQAAPIRETGRFYLPVGDARQSMVDVRDIAEATVRILTGEGHEDRIYELTGPESLSCFDVAATLSEVLGRAVTYVPVAVEAARRSMLDAGMREWEAGAVAELQGVFATGAFADVRDDLARLLGRRPRSFADFARDHAAAFARPAG